MRYTRIYDTRHDTDSCVISSLHSRRAYPPVPTHYVSTMCHTEPALAGERVPLPLSGDPLTSCRCSGRHTESVPKLLCVIPSANGTSVSPYIAYYVRTILSS